MGKKDQETSEPDRYICDAEGWCSVMKEAILAMMTSRKGLRVGELCGNKTGDFTQAVICDFGMKNGWALVRFCPFCGGNPNARFKQADEVAP